MQSMKQLNHVMGTYLSKGIPCVYLSATIKDCQYHLKMMYFLYRIDNLDMVNYRLHFEFAAPITFKSTSNPPHTLNGYKDLIIPDHNAFRLKQKDEPEFWSRIYRSHQLHGVEYENHKSNGYRPSFSSVAASGRL